MADLAKLFHSVPQALGFRQGVVIAWDPLTGANQIDIGGTVVDNLPTLAASTIALAAGDVVGLISYKSTFFITGRIAPAGGGALAIRSATVFAQESTTSSSYTDLTTPGPSVDAYIGPSRQCLVIVQASIGIINGVASALGRVTGASSLDVPSPAFAGLTGAAEQVLTSAAATSLLTADNGLNPGLNHFTVKYARTSTATGGGAAIFGSRTITVIPF